VLRQLDTPANMYNAPANLFVAAFVGSPPMNLLDGELAGGHFSSAAVNFSTLGRVSRRAAVAGVRPEDCRVTEPASGKIVGEGLCKRTDGRPQPASLPCRRRHDDRQGGQIVQPPGRRRHRRRLFRRGGASLPQGRHRASGSCELAAPCVRRRRSGSALASDRATLSFPWWPCARSGSADRTLVRVWERRCRTLQ
jgi:hypothetical protein